jgi:hypothetical protein
MRTASVLQTLEEFQLDVIHSCSSKFEVTATSFRIQTPVGLGSHFVYITPRTHASVSCTFPITRFTMSGERTTVWNAPAPAALVDPTAFIGKKPNKIIPVPPEYRRQTLTRERETLINDLRVDTNCHVVPHWDQGGIIMSFDIYGTGSSVEKAIGRINQWISNAHVKAKAAASWAKLPGYNFNDWYYEQVEQHENIRKQLYKGPVPPEGHPDAPCHFVSLSKIPQGYHLLIVLGHCKLAQRS